MRLEKIVSYNLAITDEERGELVKGIKGVEEGEGSLGDFAMLNKFFNVLNDLGELK